MTPNTQSSVQGQCAPRLFWTRLTYQTGLLFLLSAVLSAGCVSKEQHEAEKVRGLNFQRLLAQEEKRVNTLNAKLAHQDKEINKLNAELKETKDKIASLESQNHDLTAELDALKEQSHRQAEPESVPDSTSLSTDSGPSKEKALSEPSLSDPFMSEEELLKILDAQPK